MEGAIFYLQIELQALGNEVRGLLMLPPLSMDGLEESSASAGV